MPWKKYNPNPAGKRTGDCTIRAICAVTGLDWPTVHLILSELSRAMSDMSNTNDVWWTLLHGIGFKQFFMIDQCPNCYTVADFAADHPKGTYILGPHEHAVAVIDGWWWDIFDSGDTIPSYYFVKEDKNNGMEPDVPGGVSAGADAGLEQSADVSAADDDAADDPGGDRPG